MTDESATVLGASEHLPAAASDCLLGGNAREILGGAVPRHDAEVLVEGEEGIAGAEAVRPPKW